MNRRSFLTDISLSLAASCAGCLAACSKSDSGSSGGSNRPPQQVNVAVNLTTELINVEDSLIRSGIIIVRLAATNEPSSFTAVQANCTHEGTTIGYNTTSDIFICPNHGSRFSTSGSVIQGPATSSLRKYTVTIDGSTLTITS